MPSSVVLVRDGRSFSPTSLDQNEGGSLAGKLSMLA
jgi:hypothetical protein